MNFNFELILFYAVIVSGVIALIDILFLAKRRKAAYEAKGVHAPEKMHMPIIIDYARSFFPILLVVFLLRSFLFEPFRIPSGSLEPTMLVGDFIIVNKFAYGVRLPVVHKKILNISEPKRGDIFVFRFPPDPSVNYIKRIVGVPGDHLKYVNKTLYVNGQIAAQQFVKNTERKDEDGNKQAVVEKQEDLLGVKHDIFIVPDKSGPEFENIVVPEGKYFAMGDNRDNSGDSRYWGFVPDENIVGKAAVIWLSWNSDKTNIRWNRFGKSIH